MKEFLSVILVLVLIALITVSSYNKGYNKAKRITPFAMDVYQGKTTLQYTVINGVKVDSIVVFKN